MFTEEELKPLQKIADDENAAIITFIAPDRLIRLSPSRYSSTSISTNDVYNLEEAIEKNCEGINKAYILTTKPKKLRASLRPTRRS